MYKYVLKRLLLLIPIMIAVSFIVYFFIDLAPGDIVDVIAGQQVSVEEKEMMREEMGLNDPLIIRYFRYMGGLLRGDLGISYVTNRDVFGVYISRLPATLKLDHCKYFNFIIDRYSFGNKCIGSPKYMG